MLEEKKVLLPNSINMCECFFQLCRSDLDQCVLYEISIKKNLIVAILLKYYDLWAIIGYSTRL